MRTSDFGRAPWRLFLIQILVLAAIVITIKLYLPRHERTLAAQASIAREQKINALFHDSIEEETSREVLVPLDGTMVKRHPWRLRTTFTSEAAESSLGVPNTCAVDFRGGQHLTWLGTSHKLEAAFDAGRLFCLTWEDLNTHHGEQVYNSEDQWRPY